MIEYLKMALVAIVTGFTSPMPVSSAAHFNFFSNILGLSGDNSRLSLYYNAFVLTFSFVILFSFRKTITKGVKLAFKEAPGKSKIRDNKYFVKNLLVSLVPTILLFIPVSKGKLLMDYMDSFFNQTGLVFTGVACVITTCILILCVWYTSKTKNPLRRAVDNRTILRMSFYQLPCYVIPGFSHIASGAVNFFICDIGSKSLFGQLYIYLAPSMFFVSIIKLIRLAFSGVLFDPVALLIGVVIFAIISRLTIMLTSKINIRRIFTYFCVYSAIFGIFTTVISFFI